MTQPPTGTLPPATRATVAALHAQIAALQAHLDHVLTAAVEGQGHDVTRLALASLDVATGAYALAPRTPATPPDG